MSISQDSILRIWKEPFQRCNIETFSHIITKISIIRFVYVSFPKGSTQHSK